MPLIDVKKQQEAKAQVAGICKDKLPSNRRLPLWTDLANPKLADVWLQGTGTLFGDGKTYGDNLSGKDEYVRLRNDWYQGNFFRTNKGHMVYIGNAKHFDTVAVLGNNLFGKEKDNYLRFHTARGNSNNDRFLTGGGWAERFSKLMLMPQSETGSFVYTKHPVHNGISYANWWDLLQKIEQSSIPTNKVIVLTYDDTGIIALDRIAQDLANFYAEYGTYIIGALAVASAIVTAGSTAALYLSTATKIFSASKVVIDKLATGKPVTSTDLMSATGGLLPKESEKYIQTAMNVGANLEQFNKTKNPQALLRASAEMGIKKEQIINVVDGFVGKKGADSASFLLNSIEQGAKVDNVMLTMTVLKAQGIVNTSSFNAQTAEMARQFINNTGKENSPIVQNIATNSLGNVMNAIIPNINNVSKVVLDDMRNKMSQEEYRSWCNMASARNDLDTALPNLAYTTMIQQAIESSNANMPYMLPPDVPKEYRACMALQITADTGIPVVDPFSIKVPATRTTRTTTNKTVIPPKAKKKLRKEYR